jgi:hypothetical protein
VFLKQSTASQIRVTPRFVDDTDFKTPETGLTIANTDVKLSKNGAAEASKNSGGGTHLGSGRYSLTFDATDTNTVGELAVGIVISGALPVECKFFVLEEAVYDAIFAASAVGYVTDQPVNVTKVGGTTQTAGDIMADTNDIQTRLPAALVGGRMDSSVGAMASGVLTATAIAADAITAAKVASDVTDEIWAKSCTEPTAVVAASPTAIAALSWLLTLSRNKITQTATTQLVRNDADSGTIATSTVSDDATTFIRGEFS